MKRESLISCLLLANVALLIYVVVLVSQKPSIHDIDARIEYWHKFYETNRSRFPGVKRQGETRPDVATEPSSAEPTSDSSSATDGSESTTLTPPNATPEAAAENGPSLP